jgi:hypothetical protein
VALVEVDGGVGKVDDAGEGEEKAGNQPRPLEGVFGRGVNAGVLAFR